MFQAETRALVEDSRQLWDYAQSATSRQEAHRMEHEALGKLLEAVEAMLEDE